MHRLQAINVIANQAPFFPFYFFVYKVNNNKSCYDKPHYSGFILLDRRARMQILEKNQQITLKKDRYTLIELIGEGGQGVIWTVKAESTGKHCALKTIRTYVVGHAGRPERLNTYVLSELSRRMQEEIDFFLSIRHKENCFIATCLDHGVIDDDKVTLPAMIMPYYPTTLAQQIPYAMEQRPDYDLPTVLRWLVQLSQAIQCTHEQMVDGQPYMHRDIKPANILLTENGNIRLIDFGIAKQQSDDTGTTSIAHAPAWVAPEQVLPEYLRDNGDNVFRLTAKTDLYNLGLVAYYLCTGGSQSKAQEELRERSQAIYTQHVRLLAMGKVGKLGEIGGLNKDDHAYLHHQLLSFFSTGEGDTIIVQSMDRLPLSIVVCEQIIVLLTQLLLPQASKRPCADVAKQQFQRLQQALTPQLTTFSVTILQHDLLLGDALELEIQLDGQGLMRPFDWLKIVDSKQTVYPFSVVSVVPEQDVFLLEPCHIRLCLDAFEKIDHYHLIVIAQVGQQTQQVEINCVVTATADQLWQQGQREEALKRELRKEWLNVLEKEAKHSVTATYRYLELLKELQQSVSDETQKKYLMVRYKRIDKPAKSWKLLVRGVGAVILILVTLLLGYLLTDKTPERKEMVDQGIRTFPDSREEHASNTIGSESNAEEASSVANKYSIQLLITSNLSKANILNSTMKKEGYNTYIKTSEKGSGNLYRVRLGNFSSQADALKKQTVLKRRYRKNQYIQDSAVVKR